MANDFVEDAKEVEDAKKELEKAEQDVKDAEKEMDRVIGKNYAESAKLTTLPKDSDEYKDILKNAPKRAQENKDALDALKAAKRRRDAASKKLIDVLSHLFQHILKWPLFL